MTIVVPKVAGVERVVACAPPRDGWGIHPRSSTRWPASGADEIFCVGGVQALAAMAFGIEGARAGRHDRRRGQRVRRRSQAPALRARSASTCSPGRPRSLSSPTTTADPELVAADLLGQAEHGPTSPAILITDRARSARRSSSEVDRRLAATGRPREIAGAAWRDYGTIVVVRPRRRGGRGRRRLAPEHLEVQTGRRLVLRAAAQLRLAVPRRAATVAFADKAIGTNHVLPTGRAARYTGGLWVGKFLKTLTYQRLTRTGTERIAPSTAAIADAEQMYGHALTARLRLHLTEDGSRRHAGAVSRPDRGPGRGRTTRDRTRIKAKDDEEAAPCRRSRVRALAEGWATSNSTGIITGPPPV